MEDGWNTNAGWDETPVIPEVKEEPQKIRRKRGRSSEVLIRTTRNIYRKAYSEMKLLDLLGQEDLKEGYQYNVLTAGDIDGLSYLKVVLRQQPLDYCLLSTWVMAADDVLQIEEWLEDGIIKKLDAYLGEVFPRGYPNEWRKLNQIFETHKCGRIAVFHNHSKVFAGYGEKYHFGIQTSANINTNPRTENGCITIGKDIFDFYKNYYDGINSIIKEK